MRKLRLILTLSSAIAAFSVPALGQTNSTSQSEMSDTAKEFDKLEARSEQLHRSTLPSGRAPRRSVQVLVAIPQFRKATADLREAVSAQQNIKVPLQSLGKLMKLFEDYFKGMNLKSAPPDVQDLKSYTHKELLWETLTTAERVDNNLQIANQLIRQSDRSGAVSIKAMQFYLEIDTDLKRLKALTDKVQTSR